MESYFAFMELPQTFIVFLWFSSFEFFHQECCVQDDKFLL